LSQLISFIIVTYNSANDIGRCLDSVFQQPYRPFEVVIYDNASQDATAKLVEDRYPQAIFIRGETNLGFAEGNNRAVAHAHGEILVFINPDTYVDDDFLAPMVDFLNSCSEAGAVTPAIMVAGKENVLNAYGNCVHVSGMTYCYQYGRPNYLKEPFEISAISGAAFAMRRELFLKLGGFETSFFMYYEDTDLSLRIRLEGYKIFVIPRSVIYHAFKEQFHPNKIFYLERNRYLSILSLFPFRVLLLMMPSLMMVELITWGYCLMKGEPALVAKLNSWRDIRLKVKWIRDRSKYFSTKKNTLPFVLGVFDEQLELRYVGGGRLAHLASFAAWVSAIPFWAVKRLLSLKHRLLRG